MSILITALDKISQHFKRGLLTEEEVHLEVADKIKKLNGTMHDYWAFCERNKLEPLLLVFDPLGRSLIENYVLKG